MEIVFYDEVFLIIFFPTSNNSDELFFQWNIFGSTILMVVKTYRQQLIHHLSFFIHLFSFAKQRCAKLLVFIRLVITQFINILILVIKNPILVNQTTNIHSYCFFCTYHFRAFIILCQVILPVLINFTAYKIKCGSPQGSTKAYFLSH